MKTMRSAALLLPLLAPALPAEDWPCWRGPRGDGISGEETAPVRWSRTENVNWRVEPPGLGHSSPIVLGDALYLTAAAVEGETVRCLLLRYDAGTGRTVWEREVLRGPPQPKNPKNTHASATPAADGERAYVAFLADGRVQAAAVRPDGSMDWRASPCGFKSIQGFCSTPVLCRDLVILNCDQDSDEACIVGLDRKTGAVRWRTERENRVRSYVPPRLAALAGRDQLIVSGSKTIASFDPADGRRRWVCAGPSEQCVATPAVGHDLVFITGGFPDREIMALRPDGEGDVTATHVAWRARQGVAYVPSPLLLGDILYVVRDEGGILCAYEARTGKLLYTERLDGNFSSSLTSAAGRIYLGSEEGVVHVFAAGPRFERVAAVEMGEGIFASPAFSGGRMYLRTTKALYSIGGGAPGGPPARPRRVLYNLDGDSCLSTKAGGKGPVPVTADDLKRVIEEVAGDGSQVDTVLVCVNAQVMYYPTKVGTMRGELSTPEEREKWPESEKRRFRNVRAFFDAGVDPYAVLLAEARRRGREALLTFRMNDDHGNDFLRTRFLADHPDWRLGAEQYRGKGAMDFGREEVREHTFRLIEEAVRRYDSDGIELDFNRFPAFFKDGATEERVAKMDALVERVRRMVDEVGRERGRRLVLAARVPSNFGRTPPTPETARELGCDVPAWARNGWVDFVAVSEFLFERGDLPIAAWKRTIAAVPVYGGIECTRGSGQRNLGAGEYRRAAAALVAAGADGVYLFNFFTSREEGANSYEPPFEVLRDLAPER